MTTSSGLPPWSREATPHQVTVTSLILLVLHYVGALPVASWSHSSARRRTRTVKLPNDDFRLGPPDGDGSQSRHTIDDPHRQRHIAEPIAQTGRVTSHLDPSQVVGNSGAGSAERRPTTRPLVTDEE